PVAPPVAAPVAPRIALDAAVAPAAAPGGELPDPPKTEPPAPRQEPTTPPTTTEPIATPPPQQPHARAAPPPSSDVREWRQQIDALVADGKINPAKNQLRDRIAVDKNDAWAHLRLGNLYADAFHYRRDALREWESAFVVEPALKSDS